jgi:hypothetical protein
MESGFRNEQRPLALGQNRPAGVGIAPTATGGCIPQPIAFSERASTIGSVEPRSSIRIARRFISANFVNDITHPTGHRM